MQPCQVQAGSLLSAILFRPEGRGPFAGEAAGRMILLEILFSVILPIFLIIGVGVVLDRSFRLDLPTLSKLNFFVFVPALVFVKLLDADLPAGTLVSVALFGLAHVLALFALSVALFSRGALRQHRAALSIGAVFYNVGNYGIPFTVLAFGDQQVAIVAMLMVTQNLTNFTLGIWVAEGRRGTNRQRLSGLLRIPVVYVLAVALTMRALGLDLIPQVKQPLIYLGNGLIPIALLTLGVQLSRCRLAQGMVPIGAVTLVRLVVSPLLAAGLVWLLGIGGVAGSVLIAAGGLPTAVNAFILASEYDRDPEVVSQCVFWTTLLSPLTLAVVLMLVR